MSPQSSRVHLLRALGAAGFREAVPGGAAIGPTPGAAVQGQVRGVWRQTLTSDIARACTSLALRPFLRPFKGE